MKCDICGEDFPKGIGFHRYNKHPETRRTKDTTELKVDDIMEKPLSSLISEIKNLVKVFRHEMDVRVSDKGGRTSEVEIRVRIQI